MQACTLSVAFIARDKFSHAVESLSSLVTTIDVSAIVYVFDSGYPVRIKNELKRLARTSGMPIRLLNLPRYANTNFAWNVFLKNSISADYVMCVENDVVLSVDCVGGIISSLKKGVYDIAVPVVYEKAFTNPHFNPTVSTITRREDGKLESVLDRGRDRKEVQRGGRRIYHLERHCFAMSYNTAKQLGALDEEMWDRTDYDMSMSCFVKDISIGIPNDGYVIFYPDAILCIDKDFMDYRWNLEEVRRANERLIAKWNLHGFKTTVNHAYAIRRLIENKQEDVIHYEPVGDR